MNFDRAAAMYCPFFCEENIWQLAKKMSAQTPELNNGSVLFFLSARSSDSGGSYLAIRNQVAFEVGTTGFWDYHVVLLDSKEGLIYDLDTRLDCPVSAGQYFAQTFPSQSSLPTEVQTVVRSVPIQEYLERFSSDRSHMIDAAGEPCEPFPKWPPIVADDPIWLNQYRSIVDIAGSQSKVVGVEKFAQTVDF